MRTILLTSEDTVRARAAISDNIASRYLLAAIIDAQEVRLKRILGRDLLTKCQDLIDNGEVELADNKAYRDLIDECQWLLVYQAEANLCETVSFKPSNLGVSQSSDTGQQPAKYDDMILVRDQYLAKADAACYELQRWILEHRSDYPELKEADCRRIKSNLYSAATCGVWLGGPRGGMR